MKIDFKKTPTNKGSAMLKLAHQFQREVLFRDDYLSWFFDEATVRGFRENPPNFERESENDTEEFQKIAYYYVVLREKYGDRAIEEAIATGCKQILLLGSGYDTRFFRLSSIQENSISTIEIDLPAIIEEKKSCLREKLGEIPPGLTLFPVDFNRDDLNNIAESGFDPTLPTAYVWQGVSYYLPRESVSNVLDFVVAQMTSNSVFIFDSGSPLMTFKNDLVPGLNYYIDLLSEVGEPFLFGLYENEMKKWLTDKGFREVEIVQQDELELLFLGKRTLPNNMWYVVTAKV